MINNSLLYPLKEQSELEIDSAIQAAVLPTENSIKHRIAKFAQKLVYPTVKEKLTKKQLIRSKIQDCRLAVHMEIITLC